MLHGALKDVTAIDVNGAKFRTALAFLARKDLAELPVGWIDLDNGVRASVQEYSTQPEEELDFETHEVYYDIHYMVKGEESIGVCSRQGLKNKVPYEAGNDIEFYYDPENYGIVYLKEGDYCVVGYEDAHKTHIAPNSPMPVKKIVLKVPVK